MSEKNKTKILILLVIFSLIYIMIKNENNRECQANISSSINNTGLNTQQICNASRKMKF